MRTYLARVAVPLVKVSVTPVAEVPDGLGEVLEVAVAFLVTVMLVPAVVIVPAVTSTRTVFRSATSTPAAGAPERAVARTMCEVPVALSVTLLT